MPNLSDNLRSMGFVPTDRESPVDEEAVLWTNGHDLVCSKTATVIDGDHNPQGTTVRDDVETCCGQIVYRYANSNKVKLAGGFVGSYNWGNDDGFKY